MQSMQRIRIILKYLLDHPWFIVLFFSLFSLAFRLYHLSNIKDLVFDEVYFVDFAKKYLSGTEFFDIHPPLGKLIIATGIKIFGDTQFGWRIMSVIFGTALIPLGYLTARELGGKIVGLLTVLILSFDGMLLVYSRLGLLDILLSFFIILSFYLFLKFANSKKLFFLILAGLSLGLAASIKYIGWLLGLVFICIAITKKIPFKKYYPFYYLIFLIIIPTAIYLGFFLFNFPYKNLISDVINWHRQSLNYNLYLTEGHPYGSKWWTWFLLLRPIWLYFKDVDGKYIGVVGLGNPLAWWSSIVVVPLLIYNTIKKDKTALIILSAFLIFLVPWAFVKRVIFIYHAIPSFIFLSFATAYFLEKLLSDRMGKVIVTVYFAILIAFFVFFLPIWIGLPLESSKFYLRTWLKGWI